MKKTIRILTFCLSVFLFSGSTILAVAPPGVVENITTAIRAGNSAELAKYFNSSLEIVLPGNDGAFSKAQGEMIMKNFFAKSAPVSFSVNQKGNSIPYLNKKCNHLILYYIYFFDKLLVGFQNMLLWLQPLESF